eukprot:Ihof_evm8s149 gene=Ihof_evmTU8s149
MSTKREGDAQDQATIVPDEKRSRKTLVSPTNAMDFFLLCGKLKTTKRTGWVHHKVKQPESISDHMHRMATMAFLCDDPTLNVTHCVKMALVHDLAESIVGDLTPNCGVSVEEKAKREDDAMRHIMDTLLEGTAAGEELYSLWREYEDNKTPAAKFVKDLDKFEMIVQAYEYEQAEDRQGELETFFAGTRGVFHSPMVKGWVDELEKRRSQALK